MTSPASRVTVDIDSHVPNTRLRLLRAVNGLQDAGAYDTEVATSSSGTGFHVVGYFDEHVPVREQLRMRANLNDDPNRLQADRQRAARGLPINTMWTSKGGNEGERTVHDTVDDAIAHKDAHTRSDTDRMRDIQNKGHKARIDGHTPALRNIQRV